MNLNVSTFMDCVIFSFIAYSAVHFYLLADYLAYDLIRMSALLYVAVRKPDANTISLISFLLIFNAVPLALIYGYGDPSAYLLYSVSLATSYVAYVIILARPLLMIKYVSLREVSVTY